MSRIHQPETNDVVDATAVSLAERDSAALQPVTPSANWRLLACFGGALVLSAAYMLAWLKTGWLHQDDGALAQSALRVFQGQLPHRDFLEIYTGGLSFVNAAGFRLFGVGLLSLRIVMFFFFLAWVPALLYVASRFASPVTSAAITLLAVAWSMPNYPTPMPSWYNLMFATFGAAALLRHLETGSRRWLFLAGVAGGCSILVKVVGLYYVAAVLLFFVYREQELNAKGTADSSRWFRAMTIVCCGLFVAVVVLFVRHRYESGSILMFLVPGGALALLLIARAARKPAACGSAQRFATLSGMLAPFAAGLALPVAVFVIPYLRSGSISTLLRAVFLEGATRAAAIGKLPPLSAQYVFYALALLALIIAAALWKHLSGLLPTLALIGAAGCMFLLALRDVTIARRVWVAAAQLSPLIVVAGGAVLLLRPQFADGLSACRRQQLMLMLALAAMCPMVQFPFAAPIYFCYSAAIVALAALALVSVRKNPVNRPFLAALVVFFTLFAVVKIAPSRMYQRWLFVEGEPTEKFQSPRAAGISAELAGIFDTVAGLAREHATSGLLAATPECPEMYFLSGLRNPYRNDSGMTADELRQAIERPDLNVVVVNTGPTFSEGRVGPELMKEIARRFPHGAQVEAYWVFWR